MGILDPVKPTILSARIIPNVHSGSRRSSSSSPSTAASHYHLRHRRLALRLPDEATKKADVEVVYAHSFYAGSGYPSGRCRARSSASSAPRTPPRRGRG